MLHPQRLQRLLRTQFCGHHLIQLCLTDSTNRLLSDWIKQSSWLSTGAPIPAGTVVIATRQTAGKGQRGREWNSAAGGLYLSLALYPQGSAADALGLTLALVWGVVDQLRQAISSDIGLKWPNDLVVGSRKLGGLLLQTRSTEGKICSAVAGLGLNVNNPVPAAGISLAQLRDHPLDLTWVTAQVLLGLEKGYLIWQEHGLTPIQPDLEAWMMHHHRSVFWQNPHQTGAGFATVLGVAETGALRVQTQSGLLRLMPGEIQLGYAASPDQD